MTDKLAEYKRGSGPLPEKNVMWPLYGAGFENLGKDGQPMVVDMPEYGPDELLVRHDAVGLCFSDIKIIDQGEKHARIYRNMKENPVVMGHEVTLVVVGVGENLKDEYKVGDRFILQADIYIDGTSYAYGYEIQGGLSRYNVIDKRVLAGDGGNYLIPVKPDTGYAESALVEPWTCVLAAYQLEYRTAVLNGGTVWIIGTDKALDLDYTISAGFEASNRPARLLLSNVPAAFDAWLRSKAAELNMDVIDVADLANPPVEEVNDIILLGADPDVIETVSPRLSAFGVFAIIDNKPMTRKVNVDMGRVHYNRWAYIGTALGDIAAVYQHVPVRANLKPGGKAWFVGAGGPMGRMHVQRAIEIADGPQTIVCSDVSDVRLQDLIDSYGEDAKAKGLDFICFNPMNPGEGDAALAPFKESGFDDVIVMAPVPPVIAQAATFVGKEGVMNVFAGVKRGTTVEIDLSDVYMKDNRHIGHSGSSIEEMRMMLGQAESGEVSTNRAVAAVGSLNAVPDGLRAVHDAVFPGKVVIYPQIKDLPLTPLPELKEKMPSVYARLHNGREWTKEAEEEFLRLMLE